MSSPVTDAKALVAAFADRLERRDWPAFAELLDQDVIYEIPQSPERIRARDRYVTFNTSSRATGTSSRSWSSETITTAACCSAGRWGEWSLAIAFFEVDGDRITKVTDFWPDPSSLRRAATTSSNAGNEAAGLLWRWAIPVARCMHAHTDAARRIRDQLHRRHQPS